MQCAGRVGEHDPCSLDPEDRHALLHERVQQVDDVVARDEGVCERHESRHEVGLTTVPLAETEFARIHRHEAIVRSSRCRWGGF